MPLSPLTRTRRDSWPPTQIRLNPILSGDDEDDDSTNTEMEHNPLAYFLSPAPSVEDMDIADYDDDDMMEFDAGIEDPTHPREPVRSVSPSSLLDGLARPPPPQPSRKSTSSPEPELSDGPGPYDDDSEEEYIRFRHPRHVFGLPLSLLDFTIDGLKSKPKTGTSRPAITTTASAPAIPTAAGFYSGSKTDNHLLAPGAAGTRGRTPSARPRSARGRTRSLEARRRPRHLWREPSPDVWSIEEETEEDVRSDAGDYASPVAHEEEEEDSSMVIEPHIIQVPAAKPRKRVRFVLPAEE